MPNLPAPLENPVDVLNREATAMRQAAEELNGQIATAEVQRSRLMVMALAFENEAKKLHEEVYETQLSFDFGPN